MIEEPSPELIAEIEKMYGTIPEPPYHDSSDNQ
jgi:hypothetical protein